MPNLADHLFRQARERGDHVALICEGESWTFARLAEAVRRLAGGLAAHGVTRGSHVGLMISARPEFILYQQAIFALGAVLTPLNIFYRRSDLAHVITTCDLDVLVIDQAYTEHLPEPADCGRLARILVPDLAASTARLTAAVDLAAQGLPLAAPVDLPDTALGMMLNTSATTGKAKGVMLSLANLRANYDRTPEWLGLDPGSVILCALPLYNTFGLNQGINATMVTGGTLVLLSRFDVDRCLDAIETHRCTFLPMVPTMLQRIVDHPQAATRDLSSVRRILTGAAPVPAALLERIYRVMGRDTVVMTAYGLTEASAIVTLEHIELDAQGSLRRPKSIGAVLPGMAVRILTDAGTDAAPGEVGEICIQGPNVMQGYYRAPEQTAEAVRDGWLHSGDLGYFDADGHGYIVDRKKDVIIRGGQNIYPADIEDVLYHIPGVREAAVIGEPDANLGELPVAYVAADPALALQPEDLIARCKAELAYYKVPVAVHFLPELPKGPTGKILRRSLRPAEGLSGSFVTTGDRP